MGFDTRGLLHWPQHWREGSNMGRSGRTFDAVNDQVGTVFRVPRPGNITKVWWGTLSVTTGCNVDVRIETPDATGLPSGTLWGANTKGSYAIADTDDNLTIGTPLTAPAAVNGGDAICVVIKVANGVPNLSILTFYSSGFGNPAFPSVSYEVVDVSGTGWGKQTGGCCQAVEYADGRVYHTEHVNGPIQTIDLSSFNSASTPDEIGNYIYVPWTCRCVGASWRMNLTNTIDIVLYDANNDTIATQSVDGNINQNSSWSQRYTYWSSPKILTPGFYRLVIKPGADAVSKCIFDMAYPQLRGVWYGGDFAKQTERTDGGQWTNYDAKIYANALMLDAVDIGAPIAGVYDVTDVVWR